MTSWKDKIIWLIIGSLIGSFLIPYIKSSINERLYGSRTLVVLFGHECSQSYQKISIIPIKLPTEKSMYDIEPDFPDLFKNWPPNVEQHKFYRIVVQNKGKGLDRNIKIDINFGGSIENNIGETINKKRVELIEGGGISEDNAKFKIKELFPNEKQKIDILVKGKSIESFTAWSELTGEKEIFIYDIIYPYSICFPNETR